MSSQYSLSDFEPRAQKDFTVDGLDGAALRLDRVLRIPHSNRDGGGFRLELVGPAEPVLEQAIYTLREAGDAFEIFLVPVARTPEGGLTYEAIFN